MSALDVSEVQANLTAAIETAQAEAVTVELDGQAVAVLVSAARFEQLMEAMEDREDIAAADAALAEGGQPIPLAQLVKDLDLT